MNDPTTAPRTAAVRFKKAVQHVIDDGLSDHKNEDDSDEELEHLEY